MTRCRKYIKFYVQNLEQNGLILSMLDGVKINLANNNKLDHSKEKKLKIIYGNLKMFWWTVWI